MRYLKDNKYKQSYLHRFKCVLYTVLADYPSPANKLPKMMPEQLNQFLFFMINATPTSAQWKITIAIFFARYLILIVPTLIVSLWLWGERHQLQTLRQMLIRIALALVISLLCSWIIGTLFPHERPFTSKVGYQFLSHAADNSYPSDHGIVIFTFAFGFLLWHRFWSGLALVIIGVAIAWSRIYLGIHWPLDMLGAAILGFISCLISQLLWEKYAHILYPFITRLYHLVFALPIRKGWVRK